MLLLLLLLRASCVSVELITLMHRRRPASRVVAFIPLIDTGRETRACRCACRRSPGDPLPSPFPLRRAHLPTIYGACRSRCCSCGRNGRASTERASLITPACRRHRARSLAQRRVNSSFINSFYRYKVPPSQNLPVLRWLDEIWLLYLEVSRAKLQAKFHYAIWSQTGPKLVADLQRAGIWPIIQLASSELARASRSATSFGPVCDQIA